LQSAIGAGGRKDKSYGWDVAEWAFEPGDRGSQVEGTFPFGVVRLTGVLCVVWMLWHALPFPCCLSHVLTCEDAI